MIRFYSNLDIFLFKTYNLLFISDNIARGLVNALLNSGDDMQMSKGRELQRKLRKQCKNRKTRK